MRSQASRSSADASGSTAQRTSASSPAAEPSVPERYRAVDRERDVVGAEDLLEQRRVLVGAAQHDGDVARLDAVAQQVEQARAGELDLGTLAGRGMELDRGAGVDRVGLVLEQAALDVVQGGARLGRVVVVERSQHGLARAELEQLLVQGGDALEGRAAALERQRGDHVHAAAGWRACRARRAGAGRSRRSRRRTRASPPQLAGSRRRASSACQANSSASASPAASSPVAVAAVDRGDLVRVACAAVPPPPRRAAPG